MTAPIDPVLTKLRGRLDRLYGDRLERAILFGSRARGEARQDSDYDVAIFVDDLGAFGMEAERLAEVEVDLLRLTGAVINILPFATDAYHHRTGLMSELRRDGRAL